MSSATRLLYYELGMDADDDGFVEWYAVITMTRAAEQDLQVLQANGFVQILDDKVLLVSDWKENNYLRPDRYAPSKYLTEYADQIGRHLVYHMPTTCLPVVDQWYTQDRVGKDREGKERKEDTKRASLEDLDTLTISQTATQYAVSQKDVETIAEELRLYCGSTGKTYKNYRMTLQAWVRRKLEEGKISSSVLKEQRPKPVMTVGNLKFYTHEEYETWDTNGRKINQA